MSFGSSHLKSWIAIAMLLSSSQAAFADGRLTGHLMTAQTKKATLLGRAARTNSVHLAVSLNLHDSDGLNTLVSRLYDPNDALYRHFLSNDDFNARFAPSASDVQEVKTYLEEQGFTVSKVADNNMLIEVDGTIATVEDAFHLQMQQYISSDGRIVHAPSADPLLPDDILAKVHGLHGLSSFAHYRTHAMHNMAAIGHTATSTNSGLTPSLIRTAYSVSSLTTSGYTGSGQTIALFELAGYNTSDISAYISAYGLATPTIVNVTLSGATTASDANDGGDEVTLDIELAMAMSPGITKIMVYDGPNSDAGIVATYNQIMSDNSAMQVSTSWGLDETDTGSSTLSQENTIFQSMAAKGQSMFAASGDSGAYDDSSTPSTPAVDDPSSQPYVTGVGGTTLTYNTSTGAYSSESAWGTSGAGGGGGVSSTWSIPSWQSGFATSTNTKNGLTTRRSVPDVSLEANPTNGYAIYYGGAWVTYGGTSCAAPLWAGFLSLVNQKRVANGASSGLGLINSTLYGLVTAGSSTSSYFHDIADSSTNLYYPAVTGYDLATGLGTLVGSSLFNALVGGSSTTGPNAPASITASSSANLTDVINWSSVSGATAYTLYRASNSTGPFTQVYSGTALTYTDTVSYAPTYYYYVEVTTSAGTSAPSSTASVAPLVTAPGAPSNLTVTEL